MERVGEVIVRDAFQQASCRIADGNTLTQDDVQEPRQALDAAERAVTITAKAVPEAVAHPDPWEFLNDEQQQSYIDEVERRRDC